MSNFKFEVSDRVQALDEDFEGVIVKIDSNEIHVENDDGIVMTFFVNELIKVHVSNILDSVYLSNNLDKILKDKNDVLKSKKPLFKTDLSKEVIYTVDLHVEKLVNSTRGLSNYDILNIQLDKAEWCLKDAMMKRVPKMVFIHGVGEGVLRSELLYLFNRYDNIVVQYADVRKYGQGATEVYFKQNKGG